jgi:MOSC domain-containing protein YiiM
MGNVVSIVCTPEGIDPRPPDHYARVPRESALLAPGRGIEGDRKGGSEKRQLNVMAAETLAQLCGEGFRTGPGEMGEQLVVSGIGVDGLAAGTQLRIGAEVIIEVTLPRTGCARFEHIQGKPASAVAARLGVMARVVAGGTLRVGDAVVLDGA